MAIEGPKPRHLTTPIPPKSFKVKPGDVVGGFIFVINKPAGIEEGMVGISIDSEPYRKFVKDQLTEYLKKRSFPREFATFAKNLQKPALDIANLDANIDLMISNKEMGRNLFEKYKQFCGVEEGDKPHILVKKLIRKDVDKPEGDKAYMIKQDGVLKTMGFGLNNLIRGKGTGPGVDRILKTATSKKDTKWGTKYWFLGIPPLWAAIKPRIKAWGYPWKNTVTSVNASSITETLSTNLAKIRGMNAQEIVALEGIYADGTTKVVAACGWADGVKDLEGRITGGEKNYQSVIVAQDDNNQPIRSDNDGNIYRSLTVKKDDDKVTVLSVEKIKPNGKIEQFSLNPRDPTYSKVDAENYQKAFAVSDDSIGGLGESLTTFISMGDRDGIGKKGQNKLLLPIDPPQGHRKYELFGIDFGKSYKKKDNPLLKTLRDDFTFEKASFVNYSIMYDNPLREKMKGMYLLAALRGELRNKKAIAEEFLQSEDPTDIAFGEKLMNYPKNMGDNINPGGENMDLVLMDREMNNYLYKSAEAEAKAKAFTAEANLAPDKFNKKALLKKAKKATEKSKEYLKFAKEISDVRNNAERTDKFILAKFAKRVSLTPSQIDILDNLEKLTAHKANVTSPDGRVKLNHIRVDREDRVPWQLEKNKDGTFNLVCEETDPKKLRSIREKLELLSGHPNKEMGIILQKATPSGWLQIQGITSDHLKGLSQHFTEEVVATARDLKGYRTQAARDEFHQRLDHIDKPAKLPLHQLPSHKEEEELREKAKVALGPQPLPQDFGDEDVLPVPDEIPPPPPPRTPLPVDIGEEEVAIKPAAPGVLPAQQQFISNPKPASAPYKPPQPSQPRAATLLFSAPSPASQMVAPPAVEPAIAQTQSSIEILASQLKDPQTRKSFETECNCAIELEVSKNNSLPIKFSDQVEKHKYGIIYASDNAQGGITFSTSTSKTSVPFEFIADKLCHMVVKAAEPSDQPTVFKISGNLDPKKQAILQEAFARYIKGDPRFQKAGKNPPEVEVTPADPKKAARP